MTRAEIIRVGDWISHRRGKGKVTYTEYYGGKLLLHYRKGNRSGIAGGDRGRDIRRVYRPKPKGQGWLW